MKNMFHHITSCGQDLAEFFEETLKREGRIVVESKDIFGRFTAESIATTALGFKGNCIKDKDSKIYELARHIDEDFTGPGGLIKMLMGQVIPKFMRYFDIKIFRQSTHDFFKKFVTDEIARREREGITTAMDVIQLLIQAKNGQLKGTDDDGNEIKVQKKFTDWSDDELIAAQVFIFFVGGFESTSKLMQMLSWELAMNQDVQKDLLKEVDEVLANLGGKPVSYEVLNKMKMLDMVIFETLRKWPPFPTGVRQCTKDYTVFMSNGKTAEIKEGEIVSIPIRAIQHDPKYFENPSKFDPYRFSEENKDKMIPGSFQSFGYGPRLCIGSRLATLETKVAFFTTLSKYSFEVCEKTQKKLVYNPSGFSFTEKVYVEVKPRKV